MTDKDFSKRTAENLCTLYKKLFDLKKEQDAAHGPDGEILEYTRSKFLVELPETKVVLPREKPCPVEKQKTKWEKFREERGLPPRRKRSFMVFDEITQDWVPRWGPKSIKKIEDQANWVMLHKPKHDLAGVDPYTYAKQEKKAALEKQKLAELKNKVIAAGAGKKNKDVKVLAAGSQKGESLKLKEEGERNQIRKRESKALMKSLKLA